MNNMNNKNKASDKKSLKKNDFENFLNDEFNHVVMSYTPKIKTTKNIQLDSTSLVQPNNLTRAIYRCNTLTQKIFCKAVVEFQITKKTRKDRWVEINFKNNNDFLNFTDGSKTRDIIESAVYEVGKLSVFFQEDDDAFHLLNLFEEVKYNFGKMSLKFTEKFATFLEIQTKKNLTIFPLKTIGKLSSFYSIRYFEIAMSYYGFKGQLKIENDWLKENAIDLKDSWFFAFSIQQLRTLFQLNDNSYKVTNDFVKNIVKGPLDELNDKIPEYTFKVQICRKNNTKKGKIEGFIFWITENKTQLRITSADSKKDQKEKREINEDWAKESLWLRMQEKYPDIWLEYFNEEKHKSFFVFDEVAKNAVYERMISEGYKI